jgi:phosphoglycerate dehydrogenase-like enzyme
MRILALVLWLAGCTASAPSERSTTVQSLAEEFGSTRNAVVAVRRAEERAPLTYFARDLGDEDRAEVARAAPGLNVVTGLTREQALERAAEADGADASYATPEFLRAATKLAWLHSHSAGVDRYVATEELAEDDSIVLTNARGVHGPAIADHVFAMLLALTRDLPVHLAARSEGAWNTDGSGELRPIALQGRTLLVVGLGGIGTEVARRAHGFGMRVIATRRGDDPGPEFVERVGKAADLHGFLGESDVVVLCVPLTPETERMIDARAFEAMKPGSYLVNIARGKVVDTEALLGALRSGRLAGACLDVTDPEPLPRDHALWSFPNVVITPHVASDAELTSERGRALFLENLRRFDAGEPLLNVVDKRAGY